MDHQGLVRKVWKLSVVVFISSSSGWLMVRTIEDIESRTPVATPPTILRINHPTEFDYIRNTAGVLTIINQTDNPAFAAE
jgi:hypothetical protein